MEEVKKIFRNSILTSLIILIIGVVFNERLLYIGIFIGSLIAVLGFYMMCTESRKIIYSDSPKKVAIIGYFKRYAIYAFSLGIIAKYFGLPMLICSVVGLMNIKINIFICIIFENIVRFRNKHL